MPSPSLVTAGMNDFLGVYLMSKDTFVKVVSNGFERGGTDFLLDGIIRHMEEYSIFGYEHKGYVSRINSTMLTSMPTRISSIQRLERGIYG